MVATLWDVGDAATAAFMEQLYWELGRGLAPAEALREAKRRLRADPRWNRPALWAGYVLIGNAPPRGAEAEPLGVDRGGGGPGVLAAALGADALYSIWIEPFCSFSGIFFPRRLRK